MHKNTKKNRIKLIKAALDQLDLATAIQMLEDQLDIYYEDYSDKEFDAAWNRIFKIDNR